VLFRKQPRRRKFWRISKGGIIQLGVGFHTKIISNLQSSADAAASSHQETGTSLWAGSEKNRTSSKSSSHFRTVPTAPARFKAQLFGQRCLAFSKRSGVAKGGVRTGVFVGRCL